MNTNTLGEINAKTMRVGITLALVHDFVLTQRNSIDLDVHTYIDIKNQAHDNMIVTLGDDLIMYIMDSLRWVKTLNPFTQEYLFGLNYHGITVIDINGSQTLRNIIKAWHDLFSSGPDILTLTGDFYTIVGEPDTAGKYEQLRLSKKKLLSDLDKLIYLCNKVSDDEDQIIVHYGI